MPSMLSTQLYLALAACPLIAILRGLTPEKAPRHWPLPFERMALLREALLDALIGAGTVRSAAQAGSKGLGIGSALYAPG